MPAVLTASTSRTSVVLALVVLAALEAGLAAAGAADRDADLEQPAQRGPLAQLGAEHVGVGVGRRRRRAAARARRGPGSLSSWSSQTHSSWPVGAASGGEPGRDRLGRSALSAGASCTASSPSRVAQQVGAARPCCRCRPRRTRSGGRVWPAQPVEDRRQPPGTVVADEQRGHRRIVTADHPSHGPASLAPVGRAAPGSRRGRVRRRASSACDARARTGRPRCRSARRSPSAYSRHSSRTSQVRQTFLASRVEPPFSGKNASGSVCAHRARSCQPSSSASPSRRYSSRTALALSTRETLGPVRCPPGPVLTLVATPPSGTSTEQHCGNYTPVVHRKSSP